MKLKDAIIYAIGKSEGLREGVSSSVVELNEVNKYFKPRYRICITNNSDDKTINLYRSGDTCPTIASFHINMIDRDQIAALIVTAYQMHIKKCKNKKE